MKNRRSAQNPPVQSSLVASIEAESPSAFVLISVRYGEEVARWVQGEDQEPLLAIFETYETANQFTSSNCRPATPTKLPLTVIVDRAMGKYAGIALCNECGEIIDEVRL